MMMEKAAVEALVKLHQCCIYLQISSTQLLQLVLETAQAQETDGLPGRPPQPPGRPSAHPEPTAGRWAPRYYEQMNGFVCVCMAGWLNRRHQHCCAKHQWHNRTQYKRVLCVNARRTEVVMQGLLRGRRVCEPEWEHLGTWNCNTHHTRDVKLILRRGPHT